jgi:Zn-dependent peptidase ImmA (M78 family)
MSQVGSTSISGLQPSEIVAQYLTAAPVNVERLASALGLRILQDFLGEYSGKIERDTLGFKITVNTTDSPVRQRFTIAHEIGHYVLHRDLIGDGISDDAMYRSRLGGFYETQANQYAAYILMPPGLFRQKFREGAKTADALAGIFDVSSLAAEYRIKNLGLSL